MYGNAHVEEAVGCWPNRVDNCMILYNGKSAHPIYDKSFKLCYKAQPLDIMRSVHVEADWSLAHG